MRVRALISWPVLAAAAAVAAVVPIGAAATRAPTVGEMRSAALGEIIESGGRALYHTSAEVRGVVACTGGCASEWLPLVVAPSVRPLAGAGVRAAWLGTVRRPDGRMQVTYRGLPLYFFSGDRRGQTNGQGVAGRWHALAPSGAVVAGASSAGSSGMGSSMGGAAGGSAGSSSGTTTTDVGGSMPPAGANPGMWCAANPGKCVNGVPVTGGSSS